MFSFPPTLILRHRKENLKKCSLRGLEQRSDILFFTYPRDVLPDLSTYVLLTLDAPPLTIEDKNCGLFLIDGTWKYAEKMLKQQAKPHLFQERSLPNFYQTVYPRRQDDCADPMRGLASVEALYIAHRILGRNSNEILNHYFWKEDFLKKNALAFEKD